MKDQGSEQFWTSQKHCWKPRHGKWLEILKENEFEPRILNLAKPLVSVRITFSDMHNLKKVTAVEEAQ